MLCSETIHIAEQLLAGVISLSMCNCSRQGLMTERKASQTDSKIAQQKTQVTLK